MTVFPPGGDAPSSGSRRRWVAWAAGAVVLIAALLAGGWIWLRPAQVTVAKAARGEAVDAVYASGVVEYVRQANVASLVTAPIVVTLAREGDAVGAGQALAQLEDGPQLQTALQLEAQAALARAAADRARRLYEAGFGSRAANDDTQAQTRAAEAAASSARSLLAHYRIKAPFAGTVLRRDAEPGDLATAGRVLFVIADPTSLRVTADVDERDIGRVAVGMRALIRADGYPRLRQEAVVAEITPLGDAKTRVFRTRLALGPSTPLRSGMTVEINLITARRANAVLVPARAVKEGAVWVVAGDRAYRRTVEVGVAGAERTEITRGLGDGAVVIVDPPASLKSGARVRAGKP